ncbi:DUF998 domain-containing protein, partial [Microbacterium sp. CPCC 204701]|uniref:DUF998 domain-containing protein n=1 Tax=Microbacterium sp. CPCC 204701 TaxID=2493084 RepID=UPI001F0C417D
MPPTTLADAPEAPEAPAVPLDVDAIADPSAPALVTPPRPARSSAVPDHHAVAHGIGRLAVLSLPAGVIIAALTTQDPLWWHLHFSQLGTFTDLSGRTFNATVTFSGFFLAAYGVFLAVALPVHTGRRTARALRGSVVSAGLHLTAVGLVPIPVSSAMHDIIASGLGLSFLAIVVSALGLPGRTRGFRRATALCVALLATGMVLLTAGLITLALFELAAFVSMGIWLLSLPRVLAQGSALTGITRVRRTPRSSAVQARRAAPAPQRRASWRP